MVDEVVLIYSRSSRGLCFGNQTVKQFEPVRLITPGNKEPAWDFRGAIDNLFSFNCFWPMGEGVQPRADKKYKSSDSGSEISLGSEILQHSVNV